MIVALPPSADARSLIELSPTPARYGSGSPRPLSPISMQRGVTPQSNGALGGFRMPGDVGNDSQAM
jgi:hypothetical protein